MTMKIPVEADGCKNEDTLPEMLLVERTVHFCFTVWVCCFNYLEGSTVLTDCFGMEPYCRCHYNKAKCILIWRNCVAFAI